MLDLGPAEWFLVSAAGFFFGLTKTGLPGIGILGVVLAASVMDAKQSVGFVLPLLITADIFAVAWYHGHAAWRHLARLMPAALVGILAGYFVLSGLTGRQLRPVIGVIVLSLLLLDALRSRSAGTEHVPARWWFAAGIGVAAGITTMLANAAGPLIVIYFLAMRFEKERFIGTSAWYFLLLNSVKAPFFIQQKIITVSSVLTGLALVPAVVAGAVAGVFLLRRIPQKWFVVVVRTLTLAGATLLLL